MTAGNEVLVERRGPVLIARLNRPHRRNAIDQALRDALIDAVRVLDEDPQLSVGVVASATPGMFCAGADLKALAAGELTNKDGSARPSFANIARRKPWIAAADGPVLGGGLEMALSCEMIVASTASTFGLPEPRRGLLAAGGGVFRLPRAIPRAVAMEMVLTGRAVDAHRAYALGLVNRVVEAPDVLEAALELAAEVGACAPLAVVESLAVARQATERTEDDLWSITREALGRILATEDVREGMAAFQEKRTPSWSGR